MKRLLAAILTFVLCIEVVLPTVMYATPDEVNENVSVLAQGKQNFTFLEGKPGDTHLVYTYESKGEKYKVEEISSRDFTEVESTIYILNSKGEFVEFATQNATVDPTRSVFEVTTNENGVIETESQILDVNPMIQPALPNRGGLITPLDSFMGGPVSAWYYGSWTDGSTRIERYTVATVTALIFTIATNAVPAAKVVVGTIGGLATLIVTDEVPLLYYKRRYAEKKSLVATTVIVGSKWDTIFYTDSRRVNEVERTTATKFLSGYVAD